MKNTLVWLLFTFQTCLFAEQSGINQYIKHHGHCVQEGHLLPGGAQERFFVDLLENNPQIRLIGETGFNAGHSSEVYLRTRDDIYVISFDNMFWPYTKIGKKYIDHHFPERHELIKGDSLVTVPEFSKKCPGMKFDFIFVDGGHTYEVAKGDILNFRALANPNALLVVDDIDRRGVARAWEECWQDGIVEVIDYYSDKDRDWVLGKYR